uniref:Cilia and flagella associated protein 119 n=1 Tax=Chelonoidis abingdonii TaxID=106734 RepID=A0A8C0G724_CHEAB
MVGRALPTSRPVLSGPPVGPAPWRGPLGEEIPHPCRQWSPLHRVLAELFELQGWESDPRAAILLDLYFYTVQFSREHNFTREQSSTFFAIVKDTHEACVETPLSNVEECYHYFTELLFCHAVRVSPGEGQPQPGPPAAASPPHGSPCPSPASPSPLLPFQRPPFSIDLFSQEQLALMSDYVVNTYFRHFKLYKYAFTPQVWHPLGNPFGNGSSSVSHAQHPLGTWPAPPPAWISPRALLQEYISAQLCQELAQLRLEVEEQLRASEEQFNTKLALLEKVSSSPKGGGRGHRK